MPYLYVYSDQVKLAYVLEPGNTGTIPLFDHMDWTEAQLRAVIFGINEYIIAWQKEITYRQHNLDPEKNEFYKVSTPRSETPDAFPEPVLVHISSPRIYDFMAGMIVDKEYSKYKNMLTNMTKHFKVQFKLVNPSENKARRLLN